MSRLQLSGGAYQAASVIASAQRALNLFAEPMPEIQGEPSRFAYYPTPGIRLLGTLPQGPIRGIRQCATGGVYAVAGSGVYRINTSDWTGTLLGSITPLRPYPVGMVDNGLQLVIVDGTAGGWTVDLASDEFNPIDSTAFYGADRVDLLDTYFVFNKPKTPQFYSSDSLATTFDPLWFANAESYSDLLVTIAVAKREIWLLGERTTEVWFNSGAADFPFQRVQSVLIEQGCRAKYSVATHDDRVYWLAGDRTGQGVVLQGANYESKRISTYAIEHELTTYPRIDDAQGYVYSLAGHSFYVLTFPHADKTWCYDITTGQWHEWLWIDDNGREHRHRTMCAYAANGMVVAGDHKTGNLYAIERDVFSDNGQPIKRQRSYPHIINDANRVFHRQFIADIECGNPGGAPVVTTRIERIITWLPRIAQLNGVDVGAMTVTTGGPMVDWDRGFLYLLGQTGYQKYTTEMVTQDPLVTVDLGATRFVSAADIDPLGGFLIVQTDPGNPNGVPVYKLDPDTFDVLDTFGTVATIPAYPASVWQGQSIVCVVCNGVAFGFLKRAVSSGVVSGFRVDTMEHSGFEQAIVSGATNNRGFMVAGKSGGSAASVFLSYDGTTAIQPSTPLYRIDIVASATSYDPVTWPTTNPGITWVTVGTIAVSAVDPAWTGYTVYSMGYDEADGNVIWIVGTQTSSQGYHVLKLNSETAAVMWNLHTDTVVVDLGRSHINGSLWMIRNPGAAAGPTTSYRINTLTGTIENQAITGFYAAANQQAQISDSDTSLMFYGGTLTTSAGSAIPVEGTSNFSNGWGFMGGQTVRTITETTNIYGQDIWLSWSDDRGHTFGSPVMQTIGARGEYLTSVSWNRLGYARDRVYRVEWSKPVATALQGAWVDADTRAKS